MQNAVLSDKQNEFWLYADHRWNVKTGATRAGKTYMDYFVIPKRLLAVKGLEGHAVILGNTRETIRRNIIIPMQEMYGIKRISNIRADNSCMMFGEKVIVLGADNINRVDRIRGMSIKYCYGDEVTTWSQEVFDMLKSRLDREYSCFDGTCNPDSPSHWFKQFLDSDADIYQQAYCIDDNPFLPQSFVENLKREYSGTVYYKRYIEGLWALAEGVIYPMFSSAVKNPPKNVEMQDCVLSIDYGTMNAFAAVLWGKYGSEWYAINEYYYSGRTEGTTKTDEEYGRDLDKFVSAIWKQRKEKPSPYGVQRIETIIDPSAASFISLLKKREWSKVRPADNAVLDGIRDTASCLQLGRIFISPACKNMIREAEGYAWDSDADTDRPIKEEDHAMDAMRYFVRTKKLAKQRRLLE